MSQVKGNLHANCAACTLYLEQWENTLEHCNKALEHSPNNGKVFYRRGFVEWKRGNLEKSASDLKTALKLCPGDSKAGNALMQVSALIQERETQSRDFWKKSFSQLSKSGEKNKEFSRGNFWNNCCKWFQFSWSKVNQE